MLQATSRQRKVCLMIFLMFSFSAIRTIVWTPQGHKNSSIVPVFLPFHGYAKCCLFCAQHTQTGQGALPLADCPHSGDMLKTPHENHCPWQSGAGAGQFLERPYPPDVDLRPYGRVLRSTGRYASRRYACGIRRAPRALQP
ncbi:MAG: hypothetical protein ZNDK_0059 [Candidatus Desulfovibrio kirbyi]|uniref:Uncharacterized protein n=1 Tax=Candidatus Desulfovibrio kirbyi TaxID=2696086 RepID=A0A6L2R3X9_9BACT|nr:MAG: hypothetical protein ZNDK_0059 [Candidatus Desulfovibrio kirbyi]